MPSFRIFRLLMGCSTLSGKSSFDLVSLNLLNPFRAFDNDEVLHVDDSVDPVRDLSKYFYADCGWILKNLDTIQSELCKKDLGKKLCEIETQAQS
jgi:hypothetical protein